MRLIDTRASEYFALHPECAACEYAKECVGGCRAAALETTPDDIMGKDTFACELFLGGWKPKIQAAAEQGIKIYHQKYGEK
jgi:sulfatase maturation enzyme AslB (radical SAM superfamily)